MTEGEQRKLCGAVDDVNGWLCQQVPHPEGTAHMMFGPGAVVAWGWSSDVEDARRHR